MPMLRFCGGKPVTALPLSRICPLVGSSKPAIMLSVVVLPEPLEPRKVRNSPLRTSSDTPSTAAKSP